MTSVINYERIQGALRSEDMTVEGRADPISAQATVYALSHYFDFGGFDRRFV